MTVPKASIHPNGKREQFIELHSPVGSVISGFILANAMCLRCGKLPIPRMQTGAIDAPICLCPKATQYPMVQPDMGKGKNVIICGSGPSLPAVRHLLTVHPEADVWAANDALMWMSRRGLRVTHGIGIDQSPDLYTTCWTEPPAVQYLIASSVDYRLIAHLVAHGHRERITLFHSFIGFEGEAELYPLLYPPSPMVGSGLNVVNRSLPLADFMGYQTMYLVGADCALGRGDILHAGETGKETGIVLRGLIDGKSWATKPDMLWSACDLVRQKRMLGDRLQFIGKTLPAALEGKDDAFLDRCIKWAMPGPPEENLDEVPKEFKPILT